jgi:hypothetical protein
MADEIDRRGVGFGAADGAGVDPLLGPEAHEAIAGRVAAQGGDVGDAGALAGGGDGGVAGVAADAFEIEATTVGGLGKLVELQHRLADADQIGRFHARIASAAALMIGSPSPRR